MPRPRVRFISGSGGTGSSALPEEPPLDSGLAIGHAEIVRLREAQSTRIASLRTRAHSILAAAGLTATLSAAISTSGVFMAPILAFTVSALFAVVSMRVEPIPVTNPLYIANNTTSSTSRDARAVILARIADEYQEHEDQLAVMSRDVRLALWWFGAGVLLTFAAAFATTIMRLPVWGGE